MRSRLMAAFAALAVLVLVAPPASADEVQDQLRAMQDRMQQMEERLQATTDELAVSKQQVDEQRELIERSGIANGSASSSGMASFLETIEIGGWVNGSYFYNHGDPPNDLLSDANTGRFGQTAPLHPDANTFALEQLWFELERPIDESNRAGFRADVLFGRTGGLLGSDSDSTTSLSGRYSPGLDGQENDVYVHQAYAQYLAPVGNGVTFKAGKFATLIGYEVIQAPYNYNITRGLVWNLLEPIDHTGVVMSVQREGWEAAFGGVNGFSPLDPDNNDFKSLLGRIGYTGDSYSIAFNALWGAEFAGNESDKTGVGNVVMTWDPNEDLSLYVNADVNWADPRPCSISSVSCEDLVGASVVQTDELDGFAWGVAVGGRQALNERTGISLRGEYVQDNQAVISGLFREDPLNPGSFDPVETTLWAVTGTVDHQLTPNLTVRGELRWDRGSLERDANDLYISSSPDGAGAAKFTDDNQFLIGVDVTYMFN